MSKFILEHYLAIKLQNFGPLLIKSSQSNFKLRSRGSYSVCSYLIATLWSIDVRKIIEKNLAFFTSFTIKIGFFYE